MKKGRIVEKKIITTKDLESLLKGTTILLDCGHRATIGHNFSNTVIIESIGGGKIRTECHNCGY
jgi:hypothetical protein